MLPKCRPPFVVAAMARIGSSATPAQRKTPASVSSNIAPIAKAAPSARWKANASRANGDQVLVKTCVPAATSR